MIRSIWAALNLVIGTFFVASSVIIVSLVRPSGEFFRWASTAWGRWALWASGTQVRLVDTHNLALDKPQIVVANHTSWYDVFALCANLPKRYRFIAKKELAKIPVFGRAWMAAGHISVDRKDRVASIQALDEAAAAIRADNSTIVIFPEGTRSADGNLMPFKKGAFMVALRTGVDIVPCAVTGSRDIQAKGEWRVRKGVITIRFGEPIPVAGYTEANRDELVERVRDAMAAMLAQAPDKSISADNISPNSTE